MTRIKVKDIREFGDFQTPDSLAVTATQLLLQLGLKPKTVVEPTCGLGSFLFAALHTFPAVKQFIGVDINKDYLDTLKKQFSLEQVHPPVSILHKDFFSLNWEDLLKDLPKPILIIGNPPWVTSSELGLLNSSNLPTKSNFQSRRGLDAITGKSNFDISEWMILQYLKWLNDSNGYIAVLCKTSVARKILSHAWKHLENIASSRIYLIDAAKYFNVSVEACFFVIETGDAKTQDCYVYDSLIAAQPTGHIGYIDGLIVADIEKYKQWRHLKGVDNVYTWRSGIKHDCAKVLELDKTSAGLRNALGETVDTEDTYLYPLFKSSDIGNGDHRKSRKYLLVTQRSIGEETLHIRKDAPKTWRYLQNHEHSFSKRKSSIYKNRPLFSIFGVGDYTFAPWKVAISGFYKNVRFRSIGPVAGRPSVFDDTIYFLPCWSRAEAEFLEEVLNSKPAKEFLSSMIFWSDKRPITAELLRRLDIKALCATLNRESEYMKYAMQRNSLYAESISGQLTLSIAEKKAHYKTAHSKTFNRVRQKRNIKIP